jgi:hypothetical protein
MDETEILKFVDQQQNKNTTKKSFYDKGGTGSSDTREDIGDLSSLKFETVFSWSDISHVAVF